MLRKIYYAYKLESIAMDLLEQYSPQNLIQAAPLDVYGFTENFLQLQVDFLNISKDKSILGLTSFNNGTFMAWDEEREESHPVSIKKGTVVIDNSIVSEQYPGRERFTVAHECSHQILHQYRYKDKNNAVLVCSQRSIEKLSSRKVRDTAWWLEWEANRLAAELLMPGMVVKNFFYGECSALGLGAGKITLDAMVDACIREMADVFQVSYAAMKIRLISLGYLIDRVYDFEEEMLRHW